MPEQVNGFSKLRSNEYEIVYSHDDDKSTVMANTTDGGEWEVRAYPAGKVTETTLATGLEGEDEAMAVLVDYMENYEPETVPDGPKSVGVFEKTADDNRQIVYSSEVDDASVAVTRNDDNVDTSGSWTATAYPAGPRGSIQLVEFVGASEALEAAVEYMGEYDPDDLPEAEEGAGELPDLSDGQSGGGVLSGVGGGRSGSGVLSGLADAGRRAAGGVTAALSAPSSPDDDDGGDDDDGDGASDDGGGGLLSGGGQSGSTALERLSEDRDRSGATALERLSEDRDRSGATALERLSEDRDRRGSSALFDETMRGGDGSGVLNEMGRDRDGPSAFEKLSDDRDRRGSSALFDETMRGGDGSGVLNEMGRDREGPSAFEKLSGDRDRESRLDRLRNAEDSNDLYGGR